MKFVDPWYAITEPGTAETFEAELRRELSVGHQLAGEHLRAVARREDQDEVLYSFGSGRWAIVHLTWRVDSDPRWPIARIFSTEDALKAWLEQTSRSS